MTGRYSRIVELGPSSPCVDPLLDDILWSRKYGERVKIWKRFGQEKTFSDMTKTFSILLSLVFVAAAQHLDSATGSGEKVGR